MLKTNIFPYQKYPYFNTFICGKRGSGKSSTLYKIVDKISSPDTFIYLFSPTAELDQTKHAFFEKRGQTRFSEFPSIKGGALV